MRRLAKLGGSSSSGTSTPPAASSSTPQPTENPPAASAPSPAQSSPVPPKAEQQEAKAQPASSQANPFSQLGMKSGAQNAGSGIRIHSTSSSTPRTATPDGRPRQAAPVSIEQWTDRTLSNIFRITLHSEQTKDRDGHPLKYLKETRQDLEEEGKSLLLSTDQLDSALLEAGRSPPEGETACYFLACWKRLQRTIRHSKTIDEARQQVLRTAKFTCFSNCIWASTEPAMYELPDLERSPLADAMLADPDCDAGIDHDFYLEAIARLDDDDDSAAQALVGAVEQISRDLVKVSMNDNFKPHVAAVRGIARYVKLVDLLTQSPLFLPQDISPEKIEEDTLLGPFFSLSPLQGEVAVNYFMGAQAGNESYIRNSQSALQLTLRAHQEELLDIVNCIIKSSKAPRDRLLDWFALVVNKNHKRRAIHVDENTVSSDGFMINVTAILDRLCEPFMDTTYAKVDRIEVDYFRRSPRVDITDETKINADQKTSDAFWGQPASGTNNFISEVFFLTVAAHHYGTEAANTKLSQLKREIKHLESQIQKFEGDRARFTNNPAQQQIFDRALKKYKDQLEKGNCIIHAVQGVLQDEVAQQRSMQLMRYVIVWIMRMVDPNSNYPQNQVALPLAEAQPDVFRCLPEYFVEDIVDNFKFVTMHMPWIIMSTQLDELLTMCITFLRSSEYIKNPGVKSGLTQILYFGVMPVGRKQHGILGDVLNESKFALKHLLHALMKFYIEAESTGAHTQFYDKFNIRYEIFQVIRCIWTNPIYRNNLDQESKVNPDFFVRFVNLTLNDVTFLLDESFGAFRQIHTLQEELKEPYVLGLDADDKKKKEELLDENQRKAKSWMQLTNETISMLRLFTEALADAFTRQEIVQRLADMLDYNLNSMAGGKQKDLKVDNPEQYHFKPLNLLDDLLSVYLNLKDKPNFLLAVARDERSYRYDVFKHAAGIVGTKALKSPADIASFMKLLNDIESTKEALEQEDEWLGEVPDEFLDPLMFTIMEDPVILPVSKTVIDRGTISQHLLSDPHDPFNRTPLKIEDVIDAVEVKEKIAAFRAEAREKARKAIEEKKGTTKDAVPDKMEVEAEGSFVESNLGGGAGEHKRKADDEGEGRGDKMDVTE
jgi:ubiquitin conjugation factor E4 B